MKALLRICCGIIVITCVPMVHAGYGTNTFFVTLFHQGGVPISEAVEQAKTNAECQPPELDPSGHWGKQVAGRQLSVRFSKEVYKTNEPIIATIVYRNAGTNNGLNCSWAFGNDLDYQFIIKDGNGSELPDSFVPPKRISVFSSEWPPGTQYKYQADLTRRYGLVNPGMYVVSVRRKILDESNNWVFVSSGNATIKIE